MHPATGLIFVVDHGLRCHILLFHIKKKLSPLIATHCPLYARLRQEMVEVNRVLLSLSAEQLVDALELGVVVDSCLDFID